MTATTDRESTEQGKRPGQGLLLLVWGGLWGPTVALLATVFDWYRTRQLEPPLRIALRFVIFIIIGILYGLVVYRYPKLFVGKKPTRAASVTRFILFIALMLGLAFVFWTMAHA